MGISNNKYKKKKGKGARYNYGKKVRTSLPVKVFKGVSIILFICLTLACLLHICTRQENIKKLTNSYVESAEVDESYYDRYLEEGFTLDMVKNFFKEEAFLDVASNVMSDRLSVLFDYRDSYVYTMDYCEENLTALFNTYSEKYSINLSEDTVSKLVKYTCDVSGISAMFIYDTPASYRTSIFEAEENYDGYNNIFEVLAILSSIDIVIVLSIMYVVCMIILFVLTLDTKEVLPQTIADTILVPSFVFLGISLGEILVIESANEVQDYVFGNLCRISIFFLVIGILVYAFGVVVMKDEKDIGNSNKADKETSEDKEIDNKTNSIKKSKKGVKENEGGLFGKSIKKVPDIEEE